MAYNITEGADEKVDNQLNDKVNDAYGVFYALTEFCSPIVGSYIYNALGNSPGMTCDVAAFLNLTMFAILFIFNGGPNVL